MNDVLEFLERGAELVPLDERRIPLIKWMHRPQSRVVTVAQLERWSNAAHGWARIIPEGQCVLDVDGPIDGETQGELPTTFTIPSSRGAHLWFTAASMPVYRVGVPIRGWKCDILPAGKLEFVIGEGKGAPDWNVPIAELPSDLLPSPPGSPHTNFRGIGGWVFPAHIKDPEKYAKSVIRNELARLRHTKPGSRNHRLNEAAFRLALLGEYVAQGDWSKLAVTAEEIGLEREEIMDTLASGWRAAQPSLRRAGC